MHSNFLLRKALSFFYTDTSAGSVEFLMSAHSMCYIKKKETQVELPWIIEASLFVSNILILLKTNNPLTNNFVCQQW
jgi:hypothetical protein